MVFITIMGLITNSMKPILINGLRYIENSNGGKKEKKKEMPEYVKDINNGNILRLESQDNYNTSDVLVAFKGRTGLHSLYDLYPATEEEFLSNQQKSNK